MSISSVSSMSQLLALWDPTLYAQTQGTATASQTSESGDTSAADAPLASPPRPPAGGLSNAVLQALQSAGVTDASSTTSDASAGSTDATSTSAAPASSTDSAAALQQFTSSLVTALHAQSGGTTRTSPTEHAGSSAVAAAHGGGHGHGHGGGHIGADLQSLIQSLSDSSDSSGTTGANTEDSSGSASTTVASADSALQTSYRNLVSALGGNSSSASLTSFLQAFSSKLGNSHTGNLINTTA